MEIKYSEISGELTVATVASESMASMAKNTIVATEPALLISERKQRSLRVNNRFETEESKGERDRLAPPGRR